ncbi:hypothetical protein [Paracoccus sp. Ld10]|uniref:hypothetical protein n=1 Tax=Paracoccus sp. Ld10 TaxID=649158 RepID=UPI0038651B2B
MAALPSNPGLLVVIATPTDGLQRTPSLPRSSVDQPCGHKAVRLSEPVLIIRRSTPAGPVARQPRSGQRRRQGRPKTAKCIGGNQGHIAAPALSAPLSGRVRRHHWPLNAVRLSMAHIDRGLADLRNAGLADPKPFGGCLSIAPDDVPITSAHPESWPSINAVQLARYLPRRSGAGRGLNPGAWRWGCITNVMFDHGKADRLLVNGAACRHGTDETMTARYVPIDPDQRPRAAFTAHGEQPTAMGQFNTGNDRLPQAMPSATSGHRPQWMRGNGRVTLPGCGNVSGLACQFNDGSWLLRKSKCLAAMP